MKCHLVRTEEQLLKAFAIRKEVFVEEQQVPVDLEIDEFDESVHASHHYVALTDGGESVGAARWREYEPGTAKLQRIAVLKRYRGTGVGKLLVETMEKEAAAAGHRKSVLDAQCAAEPFYLKLGYVTESIEPFLDAGIPHVRMSKYLKL